MKKFWLISLCVFLGVGLLTACGDSSQPDNELTIMTATPGGPTPVPVATKASSDSETTGYPEPTGANTSAYPAATMEGVMAELPEAEIDLPQAEVGLGVVGGVLASEITGQGYLPITPQSLILGEVLTFAETGQPAFIRSSDTGLKAELLPTGVFIFRNVPPGEYGLVMDMGFGTFPVQNDEGILMFTVEPGQVLELGTVLTLFPGDGNE